MTISEPIKYPRVHLWIYNHPFHGISDQIEYFLSAFRQNGYPVSIGRDPCELALNVVIENFSARSRDTLIDFCTRTRKRVAVIMTEHIDFIDRRIFIHGDPLWSDNDYMHPATQAERLKCLLSCQPYIKFLMVLGDLPELKNFNELMFGMATRAIPFPAIEHLDSKARHEPEPEYDLLFTGFPTEYRERLLPEIRALGFSVRFPGKLVSRKQRDILNESAKIVLNIPQRKSWRWLSSMRIIAGLRCGRATVSIGTNDTSRIAACTFQVDLNEHWQEKLGSYITGWSSAYDEMYEGYCGLVKDFETQNPFPHDLIEYWAITDRVRAE
ncbi:hypothetical protein JQ554_01325 [Bradyrhizobium diazoefficiens]|nr:hypothetical protein [Bradyrhizobium diazoefficiens]MBR0962703.1 hypothetical protein [Bradyrhizobium diazoefficiens]MBR0976863.1 hypothetical protein [Bradyrhizobium diazoefficiens]MBR1005508.1 hypothetical protein [Bradyrhizobium diazoefficiens]MBR1011981.1 hypothetical protein [Bradyrhizobium diazoefficiens]MBR1049322.1 hypothetical protein [Bradyrhizobium diazoefficiens]